MGVLRFRRRRALMGLAITLACAAPAAAAPGRLSAREYRAQANAICAAADARLLDRPPPTGRASQIAFLVQSLRISAAELAQLRALRGPAGLQRRAHHVFDLTAKANQLLELEIPALRRRQDARIRRLVGLSLTYTVKAEAAAKRLRLRRCSG